MTSNARSEVVLARIEANLIRSDPSLAAEFERFNALAGDPPGSHGQPRAKKLIAYLILPVVAVAMAWAAVTGSGSQDVTRSCAVSTSPACAATRPACEVVSAGQQPGSPCGNQPPPNAP